MKFKEEKEIIKELVTSGHEPDKIADDIIRKIVNPLKREHDKELILLEAKIEVLKEEKEELEEELSDA